MKPIKEVKKHNIVIGSESTKNLIIEKMSVLPDNKKVQSMKEFYLENPVELGVQAPINEELMELSVSKLVKGTLPHYQRGYEHSRTAIIVQSIIRFGIVKSSIITVIKNRRGKISFLQGTHDGRHRVVAYWILGIPNIMANVIQFKNEKDEIDYFNMINAAQKPLSTEQRLFNNFQANHPLALLIYDLGYFNLKSKWNDKVALRGIEGSPKGKITVPNFTKIVNWAGFGLRRRMEGESDIRATRKLEKMDINDILNGVNAFHDWFYQLAKFPHYTGDMYMKDKVLISFLEFFHCAINQNSSKSVLSPERILSASLNKFRGFNFNELQQYDASTAPNVLFELFNGKGKRSRANPVKRLGI